MLILTMLATGTSQAQFGPPFTSPAALNSNASTDGVNDKDKEVSVATDGGGNWVAVWSSTDDLGGTVGTDQDIFVSRSTDNGATWTAVAALNSNAATDSGKDKKPVIATDVNGVWVVVWESDDTLGTTIGADKDILWARSTNNGASWSTVAALNSNAATDTGDDKEPRLATDNAATSNWIVVWDSLEDLGSNGTEGDIFEAHSTDSATTWSSVATLNSNANTDTGQDKKAFVATDTGGVWVAVWESLDDLGGTIGTDSDILWSRSTNNGTSWSTVAALNSNAATDTGDDMRARVAADQSSTSTWVTAWDSTEDLGSNGTEGDIFEAHSTDDATTWSAVATLNSNANSDTGVDKEAFVATDARGLWIVAWDTDDDLGATIGTDQDVAWACSNDEGSNWSLLSVFNNNADSDAGNDKKPALATDGACHWVVAWESDDALGATIGTDFDILTARPQSGVSIDTDLDGFWKLNDGTGSTATDSSGGDNHGTVTGAAWTDGMFGNALSFDAAGDYVDVPTTIGSSSLGSVSFWFKTSTNFADLAHMYYASDVGTGDGAGPDNELHVNFTSSGTVQFFIEGTPDVSITTTSTYADGAWHSVSATWDINDYASFYVDGKFVGSAFHNADNFSFSSTHRLGRPGTNTRLFTGRLDDVRLYNRVLTACEIGTLAKGHGLLAHWKFDDGSGTTAADSSGTNDGTLTNGPTWVTLGKQCGALDFNQPDSEYVNIPASASLNISTDATISGWFKLDATFNSASSTTQIILEKYLDNGNDLLVALVGTDYGQASVADGSLLFKIEEGGSNARYTWTGQTSWTGGQWYHFATTLDVSDNARNQLFVDGTADTGSTTGAGTTETMSFNADINIGGKDADSAQLAGAHYFDGVIDDIRLYNRILTGAEIQSLAATYQVVDLGSATGQRSLGHRLNDSEQVVGFDSNAASGDSTAWSARFCDFTTIPTLTGGSVNEAIGINAAGKVVGWSDSTGGVRKAYMWTSGGGTTDLGLLSGRTDSEAFAINSSDEVVGNGLDFGASPDNRLAFLYLPVAKYGLSMGMNSLGTLGGDQSVAMDLNDSGQVVGGAQDNQLRMEPFIWLPSAAYGLSAGMNSLGTLGGVNGIIIHRAQAINSTGEVVGLSYTVTGDGHGFHWQSGTMTDMGTLTGGDTSWALDINDSGIAVGTANVTGGTFHAFIWDGTTMSDLNDLIDSNSGWTLTRATAIDSDREIVGWGTNQKGQTRAFMLVQTCAGSTGTQGFSTSLAQGFGTTDFAGRWEQLAVDQAGDVLAEIQVTDAAPGEAFRYNVARAAPNASGAPGPGTGTFAGFSGRLALDRTLTVETPAQPGDYVVTVTMVAAMRELNELGVKPADVQLHVLDRARGVWVPAGVDVGRSAPTGRLGDSGYQVFSDGRAEFWAVRDAGGLFAVGARADTPVAQAPSAPGAPPISEPPSATRVIPPVCGMGLVLPTLFCLTLLFAARSRARRMGA